MGSNLLQTKKLYNYFKTYVYAGFQIIFQNLLDIMSGKNKIPVRHKLLQMFLKTLKFSFC